MPMTTHTSSYRRDFVAFDVSVVVESYQSTRACRQYRRNVENKHLIFDWDSEAEEADDNSAAVDHASTESLQGDLTADACAPCDELPTAPQPGPHQRLLAPGSVARARTAAVREAEEHSHASHVLHWYTGLYALLYRICRGTLGSVLARWHGSVVNHPDHGVYVCASLHVFMCVCMCSCVAVCVHVCVCVCMCLGGGWGLTCTRAGVSGSSAWGRTLPRHLHHPWLRPIRQQLMSLWRPQKRMSTLRPMRTFHLFLPRSTPRRQQSLLPQRKQPAACAQSHRSLRLRCTDGRQTAIRRCGRTKKPSM
eukprot:m.738853 g.738853  ORF g.738853 m.738853 type:complete len:307 (+) comp23100_c0_seq5:381-1301(+)